LPDPPREGFGAGTAAAAAAAAAGLGAPPEGVAAFCLGGADFLAPAVAAAGAGVTALRGVWVPCGRGSEVEGPAAAAAAASLALAAAVAARSASSSGRNPSGSPLLLCRQG
jgi:hypothetical protein